MTWVVLRGTFLKVLLTMRRYLFNTLSMIITLYIVFCLIFFGARALIGGADMGDTLEGLIVGYFVWMLALLAYSDLAWYIYNEAQMGTLEQMYLTPAGFHRVNAAYLVSNLAIHLMILFVMLGLMIITSGQKLHLDLISILPLLLLTVGSATGVGFIMGGLALVYKRIQASMQILQFVFVIFLTIPLSTYPAAAALPLAMGNSLLRMVMVDGLRLWELPGTGMLILTLTSAFYLALGLWIFSRCERIARRDGLLGQY